MRVGSGLLLLSGCIGAAELMPGEAVPPADVRPVEVARDAGRDESEDSGVEVDAGTWPDAGQTATDAGSARDAGAPDAGPDDAGVFDAGRVDAGLTSDAGVVIPSDAGVGRVEVLIAQGRLGRRAISCDDGVTWNDRDEAMGQRCGDPPLVECFHHPWASMGLAVSGRSVLATYGWGPSGAVLRTTDGVTWQPVTMNTAFSAIASGNGVVMGAASPPQLSVNDGTTWMTGGSLNRGAPTRYAAFVPGGGGRFLITADDAVLASDDRGATFRRLTVPANCLGGVRGLLTNASTVLIVRWDGGVCTSSDRGETWMYQRVAQAFSTTGVHANGAFFIWNGATRYRSADGVSWTSAMGSPSDAAIGTVAVTSRGTFVAFKGGWQSEYTHERVYRSADGLTWQVVPSANHAHSHPITHLIAAQLDASATCPAGP